MKKHLLFAFFLGVSISILSAQDSTIQRLPNLALKVNFLNYVNVVDIRTISLQVEHKIWQRYNFEHDIAYLPRLGGDNIKAGFRYRGMLSYYGKGGSIARGFVGASFMYQEKTYRKEDFFPITQEGDDFSAYQHYGKYDAIAEKKAIALHGGLLLSDGHRILGEFIIGLGHKWYNYRYENVTPNSHIAQPSPPSYEVRNLHVRLGMKIGFIIF